MTKKYEIDVYSYSERVLESSGEALSGEELKTAVLKLWDENYEDIKKILLRETC